MTFGRDRQGGVKMRYNYDMKTKPLTFLLALTFLFLFSENSFGVPKWKYRITLPPPPSRSPMGVPSFIYVWVVWEKNFE